MFITDLDGDFIRGTNTFKLETELIYDYLPFGKITSRRLVVPAGFITDFASIPRAIWAYLAPSDPVIRDAAVIHDYLYSTKMFTRKECDEILFEAMLELGARRTQAYIVYLSVRLFGFSHWK